MKRLNRNNVMSKTARYRTSFLSGRLEQRGIPVTTVTKDEFVSLFGMPEARRSLKNSFDVRHVDLPKEFAEILNVHKNWITPTPEKMREGITSWRWFKYLEDHTPEAPIADSWISIVVRPRVVLANLVTQTFVMVLMTAKYGAIVCDTHIVCPRREFDGRPSLFSIDDSSLSFLHITESNLTDWVVVPVKGVSPARIRFSYPECQHRRELFLQQTDAPLGVIKHAFCAKIHLGLEELYKLAIVIGVSADDIRTATSREKLLTCICEFLCVDASIHEKRIFTEQQLKHDKASPTDVDHLLDPLTEHVFNSYDEESRAAHKEVEKAVKARTELTRLRQQSTKPIPRRRPRLRIPLPQGSAGAVCCGGACLERLGAALAATAVVTEVVGTEATAAPTTVMTEVVDTEETAAATVVVDTAETAAATAAVDSAAAAAPKAEVAAEEAQAEATTTVVTVTMVATGTRLAPT